MTAPYIVREEPQHREPMPAYIPDWHPDPAPCRCVATAFARAWLGLDAVLFLCLALAGAL